MNKNLIIRLAATAIELVVLTAILDTVVQKSIDKYIERTKKEEA